MKKVTVTGAAGFIGSHLVSRLLDMNYYVVGLDNLSTGKKSNINLLKKNKKNNNFEFFEEDMSNLSACVAATQGADVIFHQAALGSVPRSITEPHLYFENNVKGLVNLLEASRLNKVKRIVAASSSSVYGDTKTLPKVESMSLNPKSPYAMSKVVGEQYLSLYQNLYGIETISLRYFNVFGPRQDPLSQYAAVIPKFILQCLKNQPITINGNGKQTRDFTYVDNVVHSNICAMMAESDATNRAYNIGCGTQTSVLDLAGIIQEVSCVGTTTIKFSDARFGDVQDSMADTTLAKTYLKTKEFLVLREGLKETVKFYQGDVL